MLRENDNLRNDVSSLTRSLEHSWNTINDLSTQSVSHNTIETLNQEVSLLMNEIEDLKTERDTANK